MNIYFCGSIKGGRQKVSTYAVMVEICKRYGVVLTEHVADCKYVTGKSSPEQVYEQDVAWLDQSDIVIAEITVASLGVGFEIAYAQAKHKPIYCFYEQGLDISCMIKGNPNLICLSYVSNEQLSQQLNDILKGASNA
ncbi:MAG: nucleoside 2-deoxyribosyltransferase [Clostridia bacterium]